MEITRILRFHQEWTGFFLITDNGKVSEIDPKIREKLREVSEDRYCSESCIDFLENYEKMESELPEEKKYDVKCVDCGTYCQVPFQPT